MRLSLKSKMIQEFSSFFDEKQKGEYLFITFRGPYMTKSSLQTDEDETLTESIK